MSWPQPAREGPHRGGAAVLRFFRLFLSPGMPIALSRVLRIYAAKTCAHLSGWQRKEAHACRHAASTLPDTDPPGQIYTGVARASPVLRSFPSCLVVPGQADFAFPGAPDLCSQDLRTPIRMPTSTEHTLAAILRPPELSRTRPGRSTPGWREPRLPPARVLRLFLSLAMPISRSRVLRIYAAKTCAPLSGCQPQISTRWRPCCVHLS
jgi:hypothetical protein